MNDARHPTLTDEPKSGGCGCIGLILWLAFLVFVFGVALRILKFAITFALDI